jgi:VWFA-related protein
MKNRDLLLWIATIGVAGGLIAWYAGGAMLAVHAQQPTAQTPTIQQPAAQTPAAPEPATPSQPAEQATVFKAQTKLVLVDSIVTDKKGNYIRDLTQKNFRVWEDNKEQEVKSFSYESGNASPNNPTKRYLVLFFDNSTMEFGDQSAARQAAAKFIEANAGANRLMAVVEFGGTLRITQNFTADADRLKKVVAGTKFSTVSPNAEVASLGAPPLMSAEADFGARSMLWAVRDLAKNLATVPGRKSLVLLTAGFPLTPERQSELSAVIDACNKANVAVYPIDVRGLVVLGITPASGAHISNPVLTGPGHLMTATFSYNGAAEPVPHLVFVQHGGGGGAAVADTVVEAAAQAEVVGADMAAVLAAEVATAVAAVAVVATVEPAEVGQVDMEEGLDPAIHRRIRFTTIPTFNREISFRRFRRVLRPTSRCSMLWPRGLAGLSFTTPTIYSVACSASPKNRTSITFSATRLRIRQMEVATP